VKIGRLRSLLKRRGYRRNCQILKGDGLTTATIELSCRLGSVDNVDFKTIAHGVTWVGNDRLAFAQPTQNFDPVTVVAADSIFCSRTV